MILFRSTTFYSIRTLLSIILILGPAACDRSHPHVVIRTDLGDITLEVYDDRAPVTATNFLHLVENGVYSNSVFYRVVRMDNQPDNDVKIEVIQGGLFLDSLINNYDPVPHEPTDVSGIKHTDGVISMARMEPGTASTEFFICIGDQVSLDFGGNRNPDKQGFASFGKVIAGMDVVRAIQALPDTGQYLTSQVRIQEMAVIK